MSFLCGPNPLHGIIYYDYILPSVAGVAALSMIPLIFIYLIAYTKGKIKAQRSFVYVGALLFITIFFTFIAIALRSYCYSVKYIASQAFILQNLFLIGWFFYRLEYIFRGSAYALSKSIITSFVAIYTLFCIYAIVSCILWTSDVLAFPLVIAGVLTVVFTICLVVVFIYKLLKIFDRDQDQNLLMVMRKTAFLVFMSTSLILLASIFAVIRERFHSIHFIFVHNLIIILDTYTSFLCIFFSFHYFNGYYMKICGCVESKCFRICCKRYVNSQDEIRMKEIIECGGDGNKVWAKEQWL